MKANIFVIVFVLVLLSFSIIKAESTAVREGKFYFLPLPWHYFWGGGAPGNEARPWLFKMIDGASYEKDQCPALIMVERNTQCMAISPHS